MTSTKITRKRITLALLGATLVVLGVLFLTPDYFPALHTYGVTVGTDTQYCSIDLVNGALEGSCETAR